MNASDITWDGTGTHAARIVQHLRANGYYASFAPHRREIHVIDPAGALTRIRPKETP